MIQIVLTFVTALFIEGLGSLVAVIGIAMMFGNNLIISALIVAIDVGKLIVVSALFNYWRTMPKPMVLYAGFAMAVSMVLTSGGAAGYLHGEFQKAIIGSQEGAQKIVILKEQQAKYQQRKAQIDDQIANLPPRTTVNQRLRLMDGFKEEQKLLDSKITELDKQLPSLQIGQISVESKAAPIFGIAKAFDISIQSAINWVIAGIILVFDPLAIFLVLLGNFLLKERRLKLEVKEEKPIKVKEPEPAPLPVVAPVIEAPEATPEILNLYSAPPQSAPPVVEPEPALVPEPFIEPAPEPIIEPEIIEPEVIEEPEPQEPGETYKSSLHLIKEDPNTIVDSSDTPHFKNSVFKDDMVVAQPTLKPPQ